MELRSRLVKVNAEESQNWPPATAFAVLPSLVLFQGEREVAPASGAMDLGRLLAGLDSTYNRERLPSRHLSESVYHGQREYQKPRGPVSDPENLRQGSLL